MFIPLCCGANIVIDGHSGIIQRSKVLQHTASADDHIELHKPGIIAMFPKHTEMLLRFVYEAIIKKREQQIHWGNPAG